jgi:hypothetical protein
MLILTNVSNEAQGAFETSNSSGYYAVSFELQTADGRTVAITKKLQAFTKNTPTTLHLGLPSGRRGPTLRWFLGRLHLDVFKTLSSVQKEVNRQ